MVEGGDRSGPVCSDPHQVVGPDSRGSLGSAVWGVARHQGRDDRFDAMPAEAEAVDRRESASLFGEDSAPVTSLSKEPACAKTGQAKWKKAPDAL